MAKNVRMADIAEKLGISVVSVSKGLAGKDGVSEEMRARIFATAQELGYNKPVGRQEPAAQRTANIGILIADRFYNENAFYSSLQRAVLGQCTKHGYSCLMELVSAEAERECIMPSLLANNKVDALIFMGEIDRRYLSTAIRSGLPFVLLDFYDEELAADSVLSDNAVGGYLMTEHLLAAGRKKIAFVGSVRATSSIMDRYLGYCKALLKASIEPRADWRLEDRDEKGDFINPALPNEMPEAFVCNCDEVALNLVVTLTHMGYHVPQDVAVTGYDDYILSTISRPPLTTYHVDVEGMAKAAVFQLSLKIEGKNPPIPTVMVPGAFVQRQST